MLDIDLFRKNPEIIRESQRRRFASVEVVDEIIMLDEAWRKRKSEYDGVQREFNKLNKAVDKLKISGADATEQVQQAEIIKQFSTEYEAEVREAFAALQAKLATVGNLVHGSVPIINDEANNLLTEVWGEKRVAPPGQKLKNHVDLVELLGIVDTRRGSNVGNLVSVNVDEANNVVAKVWGEKRVAPLVQKLKTHVDLVELLGIVDTKKGANDSVSINIHEANNVVSK